jgi:hypothetical protein
VTYSGKPNSDDKPCRLSVVRLKVQKMASLSVFLKENPYREQKCLDPILHSDDNSQIRVAVLTGVSRRAGQEDILLNIASAYEAASKRRIPPPAFGSLPLISHAGAT